MPARKKKERILNRTANDDALVALSGADFHLKHVRELALTMEQPLINQFHWHLRAFFWELFAVADIIKSETGKSASAKRAYSALQKEDWFDDIRRFRNHAHFSFNLVEAIVPVPSGKPDDVFIARPDDWDRLISIRALHKYTEKMAAVAKSAVDKSQL